MTPTKWSYGPLFITADGAHLAPSPLPPRASSAVRGPIFARLDPVVHPSHGRDLASQHLAASVTSQANRPMSICVTVQVQMLFVHFTNINQCDDLRLGVSLHMSYVFPHFIPLVHIPSALVTVSPYINMSEGDGHMLFSMGHGT